MNTHPHSASSEKCLFSHTLFSHMRQDTWAHTQIHMLSVIYIDILEPACRIIILNIAITQICALISFVSQMQTFLLLLFE